MTKHRIIIGAIILFLLLTALIIGLSLLQDKEEGIFKGATLVILDEDTKTRNTESSVIAAAVLKETRGLV